MDLGDRNVGELFEEFEDVEGGFGERGFEKESVESAEEERFLEAGVGAGEREGC